MTHFNISHYFPFMCYFSLDWENTVFLTARKCEAHHDIIYILLPLFLTKIPVTISFLSEFIHYQISILSLSCTVAKSPLLDIYYFEKCLSSNHILNS